MKRKDNKRNFLFLTKRLVHEIRAFRSEMLITCLLLFFSSLFGIGSSYFIGKFTDALLSKQSNYKDFLLLMIIFIVLSIIISLLNQYYWGVFYQNIAFELRKKTVNKVNTINYSWIESHSTGDLIIRLNNDLNQLLNYYSQIRNIFVSFIIALISFIYIVIFINPFLAISYLVFPCIMQIYIYRSSKKLENQFQKRQEYLSDVSCSSQDFLNNTLEIKAMNLRNSFIDRYNKRVSKYIIHMIKLDKACSKNDTILEALGFFQSVILIVIGGVLVFGKMITIGDLLVAQLLSSNINSAITGLSFFQLRINLVSAFRIFELWDEEDRNNRNIISQEDIISLSNVDFTYPQRADKIVLENINLKIEKNQKIAIVGPSGSGKSSIIKLLVGFYKPTNGKIICSFNKYAMIEQDTFLFADSFYHNIACGNEEFMEKRLDSLVTSSAKSAEIHEFIFSTELGYESDCTAYGANLSEGQRQRISIARCLCKNADLILLDEPTSSLDHETEVVLFKKLIDVFHDKTIIMITHNVDLIKDFDYIYLIQNGQIIDSGKHNQLLKNDLYYKLLSENN